MAGRFPVQWDSGATVKVIGAYTGKEVPLHDKDWSVDERRSDSSTRSLDSRISLLSGME
jgi:hypothetical protein